MIVNDKTVSNYPRGQEVPAMTPELAKSTLRSMRLAFAWMFAPHVLWISAGFLVVFEQAADTQFNSARQALLLLPPALIILTLVARRTFKRYCSLTKRPNAPFFFGWVAGLIPLLGMIGPFILVVALREDLEKFGVSTPDGRFPGKELQAIVDASEAEVLTETSS